MSLPFVSLEGPVAPVITTVLGVWVWGTLLLGLLQEHRCNAPSFVFITTIMLCPMLASQMASASFVQPLLPKTKESPVTIPQ